MRRLLLACSALVLLGCGSDSTAPDANVVGTWNLQTVNNSALPFTLQYDPNSQTRFEIVSDQYVVHDGGTYDEMFTTRETVGTQVTDDPQTDAGTWSVSGNRVTLTASDGTPLSGTVNGDHITANISGFALVYVRQ